MRHIYLPLALSAVLAPNPAQTLYVDANVQSPGNGSSWSSAFRSLAPALAAAAPGTHVWVAHGVYDGGLTVPARVRVLGGFAAGMTRTTQRRPLQRDRSTIDAKGTSRGLVLGDGSRIDGLVIRNGRAASPGGGGILCEGATASVLNCLIQDCDSSGAGAAIRVMPNSKGVPGKLLLLQTVLRFNGTASSAGVACVQVDGSQLEMFNCGVADNGRDGVEATGGATVDIRNTYFLRNGERGLRLRGTGWQAQLSHLLFFANGIAMANFGGTDIQAIATLNASPFVTACIAADPMIPPSKVWDYTITAGSPLVDAGAPVQQLPQLDPRGVPRSSDGDLDGQLAPDIGPHELIDNLLSMSGSVSTGASVTISVSGTRLLPTIMEIAVRPSPVGIPVSNWGLLLLDVHAAHLLVPWSGTGGVTQLHLPPLLTGSTLALQNLCIHAAGGAANLSNALDLQVQ